MSRLGIPQRCAVADDDAIAVGCDPHSGQRALGRKLFAKPLQDALHFPLRHFRRRELAGRPKNHEIVKAEAQLTARTTLRLQETFTRKGADLRGGEAEHRRHLPHRIGHT